VDCISQESFPRIGFSFAPCVLALHHHMTYACVVYFIIIALHMVIINLW